MVIFLNGKENKKFFLIFLKLNFRHPRNSLIFRVLLMIKKQPPAIVFFDEG